MRMTKTEGKWIKILQAECPACRGLVERQAIQGKRFPATVKCPHCDYKVDQVYFD